MQNQYIKEMLDLPELQINQILSIGVDEIHIETTPVAHKQSCPLIVLPLNTSHHEIGRPVRIFPNTAFLDSRVIHCSC
jgi:hypothetical protein